MSLDGQYDPDNIFAKIVRREIPAAVIYEDDETLAFMDVFPQSRGHCLVISKTATARNIMDVEAGALTTMILAVQRVARAVREALQPDGVVVTQFNGAPAGQTIFHLHFHIIPRWADQPLGRHAGGGMADAGELKTLAEQIASKLK